MIDKKKIVKLGIIGILFAVNLVILMMFNSVKSTFTSIRVVYADTQVAVPSVTIASNGKSVGTTDSEGKLLIPTSDLGEEIVLVSDATYQSKLKVSELNPNEPIQLLKKGTNYIYGKLNSNANLNTVIINFDNKEFEVDADGTFILTTTKKGKIDFTTSSDYFQKLNGEISVVNGINVLSEEIPLQLRGSLFFKNRSYIEEQAVSGISIEAESVNSESIIYSESETKLLNLTPGKEYYLRIKGNGINPREYLITASNSPTPFGAVRLVETGYFPWLKEDGNDQQLFLTDFDGKARHTVVAEDRTEIQNVIIDNAKGKLHYRSDEGDLRNQFPVIEYDLTANTKSTITQSNLNLFEDDIYVNYDKDIVITNTKVSSLATLKLYNLKGEYIRDIYKVSNTRENINNVILSSDGRTAFIQIGSGDDKKIIISELATATLTEVLNGNRIDLEILAVDNVSGNFVYRIEDFVRSYNLPNRQDQELAIRDVGENFMFDNSDNNLLYFTLNDEKIVQYKYDTNFVEDVITFDKLNKFDSISQEGEYLFTISGRKINIFSKNAPSKFKTMISE